METSEIKNASQRTNPTRLTKRGEAAVWAAGVGLATVGAAGTAISVDRPDFTGTHEVQVDQPTVTDLANEYVEGSEDHIKATVNKIVEMNPDVFQDGKPFVGHEDLGESIDVPESVK